MFRRSVFYRPQRFELADNQVLALKGRQLEITCLAGLIWVTDGVGGDRVIRNGQQATLRSAGRICVQALAPSVVRIHSSATAAYAGWQHTHKGISEVPAES
jgi:hypothetical protein